MIRPVCVECGREMNCVKNEIVVYHPFQDSGGLMGLQMRTQMPVSRPRDNRLEHRFHPPQIRRNSILEHQEPWRTDALQVLDLESPLTVHIKNHICLVSFSIGIGIAFAIGIEFTIAAIPLQTNASAFHGTFNNTNLPPQKQTELTTSRRF